MNITEKYRVHEVTGNGTELIATSNCLDAARAAASQGLLTRPQSSFIVSYENEDYLGFNEEHYGVVK